MWSCEAIYEHEYDYAWACVGETSLLQCLATNNHDVIYTKDILLWLTQTDLKR